MTKIIRSPHDRENPFLMVNREFIRQSELSLEAKSLLLYFLSFDPSYEFHSSTVWKALEICDQRFYRILNELRKEGYILRKIECVKGPKGGMLNKYFYTYSEYRNEDWKKIFIEDSNNFTDTVDSTTVESTVPKKSNLKEKQEERSLSYDKDAKKTPAAPPNLGGEQPSTAVPIPPAEKSGRTSAAASSASSGEARGMKKEKPLLKSFGRKIAMKEEQFEELCIKYGKEETLKAIEEGDDWMEASGKKYKDYGAFVRNWLKRSQQMKNAAMAKKTQILNKSLPIAQKKEEEYTTANGWEKLESGGFIKIRKPKKNLED